MSLDRELQAQLAALQRRLESLEQAQSGGRAGRRWLGVALVAAFVLGGLVLGNWSGPRVQAAQDKDGKEIVCTALKILDARGNVLWQAGGDDEGGFMKLFARDGKERAFVGVGAKQAGGLVYLNDPDGKSRSIWDVNRDGFCAFTTRSKTGKPEVWIGSSFNGWGGIINVNNPDGKSSIIMDVSEKGFGGISVSNSAGKPEVWLGSSYNGWGGLLNLNGPNGKARMIVDVDDTGEPRINMYNNDSKRILFGGSDKDGGLFRIFGNDEKERLFLGVGSKMQGGLIYFRDGDNDQNRLQLGVEAGAGYCDAMDRAGKLRGSLK